MRYGNAYWRECRVLAEARDPQAGASLAAFPSSPQAAETSVDDGEAARDESTAQLLADAQETIETLQRSEAKREDLREVDDFAGRIADVVAERVADQLAAVTFG